MISEELKQDKKYLKMSIKEAEKGVIKNQGGPFGCIIVKDDKVLVRAHNTVTSKNDPTAHAEVNAIRKACKKLKTFNLEGCTLYTSCEPCPMCYSAIYWAHIDRVVYCATGKDADVIDFDDEFIKKEIIKNDEDKSIQLSHITLEESLYLFNLWLDKQDKIQY